MIVFRIAKTEHVRDLTGTGARLYGGRWNHPGVPVLYTSETRALATVELLVHMSPSLVGQDLSIASVEIPDGASWDAVSQDQLPADWRSYPPPVALPNLGTEWARSRRSLLLRVPSTPVPGEYNVLVNPMHDHSHLVTIVATESFALDGRLRQSA